ncbi:FAD-dependent oxidoreductase [bacterium]|nr:FAD-dependent oxidoreductase [bacterium]
MKKDVIVVGGGPAGIVASLTAKKYYPEKEILLIRKVKNSVIPCGIPYMVASLKNPEDNKLGYAPLEKNRIETMVDEVIEIDRKNKKIKTKNEGEIEYEKLILATGAIPILPPIEGIEKKGIFPIIKDLDYLKLMIEEIRKSKNILVVGGGFIGVEFADEISNLENKNVFLVEILPELISNSFDHEFSQMAKEKLENKGVNVLTGVKVEKFIGDEKIEKVKLSNGEEIAVDAVILGIGAKPNTEIAEKCGIEINSGKGIVVDEYMRTNDPDIFAVGDCAEKKDFYTRRTIPVMLASTATAEARVAGANLFSLKVVRENKGTIAIYSTYVSGFVLGSAGLTEKVAKKEGFEIVVGQTDGFDKHPSTMPGTNKVKVKLIFSKHSGIILGGQVAGGISCGEMINTIGVAIQKRVNISELETLQMATHPYLTSAPTIYPIVLSALDAIGKLKS